MTQPFRVEWSQQALADWRRLSIDDAKLVARAVGSFPMEGIVIATSPSEYLLLVGALAVVLVIDGDVVNVDRVRRA
jgi:hypothetical protein